MSDNLLKHHVIMLDKGKMPLGQVIVGFGQRPEEAWEDARNQIECLWGFDCYPCTKEFYDFARSYGSDMAQRMGFLGDCMGEKFLDLYPHHMEMGELCRKYNISAEDAKKIRLTMRDCMTYSSAVFGAKSAGFRHGQK